DTSHGRDVAMLTKLMQALHKRFPTIDLNASLMEVYNDDMKRYYAQREASLVELEQIGRKLIAETQEYRLQLDREKDGFRQKIVAEFQAKELEFAKRVDELNEREKKMNLQDPKSTRRGLRHDILGKLNPERITKVDIKKTWPIHTLFIAVGCFFLSLAG